MQQRVEVVKITEFPEDLLPASGFPKRCWGRRLRPSMSAGEIVQSEVKDIEAND